MFAVQFRIYSTFNHGAKKGKPNPESFHTLTLYRDPDKNESVGDTLKRAKSMCQEGTKVVIINPGPETERERLRRQERQGLEVVVPKSQPAVVDLTLKQDATHEEAGDVSLVRDVQPITILPTNMPALPEAVQAA